MRHAPVSRRTARRSRHVEPYGSRRSGNRIATGVGGRRPRGARCPRTARVQASSGDAPRHTFGASGPATPCSRPRWCTRPSSGSWVSSTREWQGRAHFFAVAAQMMRRVLVDHARERTSAKRARSIRVELNDQIGAVTTARLRSAAAGSGARRACAPRSQAGARGRTADFGGLSEQEVGAVLSLSRATVTGSGNPRGLGSTGASRPALTLRRAPISVA